ncbi:Hypothetical protein SCF082_LOCUS21538, partial [Durusdinium trenchii]
MESLRKEFEALLSQPTLQQRGHQLWEKLAFEGTTNPLAVVLGCFIMRTAQMGVQVDEKVLRSFWPEELQHEVLLKFQQEEAEAETTFLELLPRCAESMIAAITSDKANKVDDVGDDIMPLHVPDWLTQWIEAKISKPSKKDAPRTLHVSDCSDPAVANLLSGSYRSSEPHHGKTVYIKPALEGSPEVSLYFWSDSSNCSGWWFGLAVGGDDVIAFHPDTTRNEPPESGWHVPFNGQVDPNFQVSFRSKPSSSDWIGVDMSKETLPQAKEALPPVQDPSPWASDSPRALGITSQSKQAAPEETLLEVPEALTTPEVPEAPHRPIRRSRGGRIRPLPLRAMKRVPQRLLRQEGRDLISSDCGSALLDALRGRLQSFTRPELFRSATANTDAPPPSVTVGMDDLDDLLLRSNLTLPLKALIAVWHAALQEVGCQNVSAEEAPGIRLGYAQFGRAFGGTSVESQGSFGVAAPKTANFSFKATGRYFSDDQHRRPRPVFS